MRTLYIVCGKRKAGTTFLYHSANLGWKAKGKDRPWSEFKSEVADFVASNATDGLIAKAEALLEPEHLLELLQKVDGYEVVFVMLDRDRAQRLMSFAAHERKSKWTPMTGLAKAFEFEEQTYIDARKEIEAAGGKFIDLNYTDLLSGEHPFLEKLGFRATDKKHNARDKHLPFFGAIAAFANQGFYSKIRDSGPLMALKKIYYKNFAKSLSQNGFFKVVVLGSVYGPVDGQRKLTKLFFENTSFQTLLSDYNGHRGKLGFLKIILQWFGGWGRAIFKRPDAVYLTISRTKIGLIRDWILCQPYRMCKIPVVAHVHGAEFEPFYYEEAGQEKLKDVQLNYLSKFIFIDQFYVPKNMPQEKAVMIRNPHPPLFDKQKMAGSSLKFGFISSFVPGKGVETFLETAKAFGGEAEFLLAGGPNAKFPDYGEKITLAIKAASQVEFLGFLDNPTGFYDDIDYLIFPTNYVSEAVPGVVVEALSRKVIPIVRSSEKMQNVFSNSPIMWFNDVEDILSKMPAILKQNISKVKCEAASDWVVKNLPDQKLWVKSVEKVLFDAAVSGVSNS